MGKGNGGKGPSPVKSNNADDNYWFDRLDAAYDRNHDQQTQQQAIAYFREKADPPEFLLNSQADLSSVERIRIPKSMWENMLRVLEKWIGREQIVKFFVQHLADANWPGYRFAFETLLHQGEKILPLVEAEIENNQGDRDWVEELEYLREELNSPS